jgi:hypothetical protein
VIDFSNWMPAITKWAYCLWKGEGKGHWLNEKLWFEEMGNLAFPFPRIVAQLYF